MTPLHDVGIKSPGFDACGLFRALHSHNPAQGLSTTYEQAHVVLDLLTLVSLHYTTQQSLKYIKKI